MQALRDILSVFFVLGSIASFFMTIAMVTLMQEMSGPGYSSGILGWFYVAGLALATIIFAMAATWVALSTDEAEAIDDADRNGEGSAATR